MTIPRPLVALILVVGTVGGVGCAAAPRGRPIPTTPIAEGTGTLQGARKFLEGRWSLLSFEVRPPGAQPVAVQGTGILTYDEFGNLRVELRADQATAEKLAQAGILMDQGVISTQGRTALDLPAKKLTYIIEGQPPLGAPSGPLAMNRPRYWEVNGDVLTLSTKDEAGNVLSVATWKKQP